MPVVISLTIVSKKSQINAVAAFNTPRELALNNQVFLVIYYLFYGMCTVKLFSFLE